MISKSKFELIKNKYSQFCSWAIWANEGSKPKDNVGDISIFDILESPETLSIIKPNVILVGLNISGPLNTPLSNFHSASPSAQDYKLRYALKDSPFWGGYLTDIIKDFEEKVSKNMMTYLNKNESFEADNIELFNNELNDLDVDDPTIIALGRDSHNILNRNFKDKYKIHHIPHYSHFMSKENYKLKVEALYK